MDTIAAGGPVQFLSGVTAARRRRRISESRPPPSSPQAGSRQDGVVSNDNAQAARRLAEQAHEVGRVSDRNFLRDVLRWISGGRLVQPQRRSAAPVLNAPWQDTFSGERIGWRERAANLDGDTVFAVDYEICRRCRLGWVEQPYTEPDYQRCGLASAGLAALRAEHPGLSWHTLGSHFPDSQAFWTAAGAGVPGGYLPRPVCPHVSLGG